MNEVWREIPRWPRYEASNLGRIRNKASGRLLKPCKNSRGYMVVHLSGGPSDTPNVHRLVMAAFVGPMREGMTIDHIDNNVENNSIMNLRYATPKQNNNNPLTKKLRYAKTHPQYNPFAEKEPLDYPKLFAEN